MTGTRSTAFRGIDLAFLAVAAVVSLFAFRTIPTGAPYLFDEADYMSAASRGIVANALEQPSMSIVTFVKTGLGIGVDPRKRTNLSEVVRTSKDITFLRHYHGPVYFYWLAAIGPALGRSEFWMRASSLLIHFLTFAAIYLGCLYLVETGPRIAALIASLLSLFSASGLGTAALVTPHIVYVFFTVLTLLLFARFLQTGLVRWWYAAVAACVFAFCSIEYAILLPITFAACLFFFRARVSLPRPALLRSAAIFFGGVLALWPLGILKLSVIKSYCFIVYLALLRKGSFGTDTAGMVWRQRFWASPFEYSLVIACVLASIYFYRRLTSKHLLLPCLIYGSLMLLTTLKNTSMNWTYVVSILPPFALASAVAIAFALEKFRPPARAALTAILLLLIVLDGARRLPRPSPPDPAMPNLLASMRREGIVHSSALVPSDALPILAYYFPSMDLHPYLPGEDSASILEKLRTGRYQTFIYNRKEGDGDIEKQLDRGFAPVQQVDSSPVTLYIAQALPASSPANP